MPIECARLGSSSDTSTDSFLPSATAALATATGAANSFSTVVQSIGSVSRPSLSSLKTDLSAAVAGIFSQLSCLVLTDGLGRLGRHFFTAGAPKAGAPGAPGGGGAPGAPGGPGGGGGP